MADCTVHERRFLDGIAEGKPIADELTKLRIAQLEPAVEQELIAAKAQLDAAQARFNAVWNQLDASGVRGEEATRFLNRVRG